MSERTIAACGRIKIKQLDDDFTPFMVELQDDESRKVYTATFGCAISEGEVEGFGLLPNELQLLLDNEEKIENILSAQEDAKVNQRMENVIRFNGIKRKMVLDEMN